MVVRFPIPVFPDVVGIDYWLGGNDKRHQIYSPGQRTSQSVYDAREQSRGQAIAEAFLIRLQNDVLRYFSYTGYRVRKTMRKLVAHTFGITVSHCRLRRKE